MEFIGQDGCIKKYQTQLQKLKELKASIDGKNNIQSKLHLADFLEDSAPLIEEFKKFKAEKCEASETFQYWDTFTEMAGRLKDLLRADREGNWDLHLDVVQKVLPDFATCDRTNYLRYASLYLEDMRKLPVTAPEIHQNYKAGKFVVKCTPGHFNSVGMDMALEQTINKSQKSSSGIIGNTKKKEFVAQWELIHHELLGVSNLHRKVSGVSGENCELLLHRELTKSEIAASESKISDIITYIKSHENPVKVVAETEKKLHNIMTQEIMPDEIREDLLGIKKKGRELYGEFRRERYICKSTRLSHTIHRNNLKTFKALKLGKQYTTATQKDTKKQIAEAQKVMDIARIRQYDMKHLFEYDIVPGPSSYLFDPSGLMSKPDKSELCRELEQKYLTKGDYVKPTDWNPASTAYLIDVMGYLRRLPTRTLKTFGELCTSFVDWVVKLCPNAQRIDFIFDTYIEGSVKDSERIHRSAKCRPIEINQIKSDTQLPVDMAAFWASPSNKVKLLIFLRLHIIECASQKFENTNVVVSGSGITGKCDILPCQIVTREDTSEVQPVPELNKDIEEADLRIIPHALHAASHGMLRVVILSNDTDVLVLAVHHWATLQSHGLHELWMRGGIGDSTRFIPISVMANSMGPVKCNILPAMHSLTGSDCTSKFGTKAAVTKMSSPDKYLSEFGRDPEDVDFSQIEAFLVQLLKPGSEFKTMDDLRYYLFHQSSKTIVDLPPTSRSTNSHILRAFYMTYSYRNCLMGLTLNPTAFGFHEQDGLLLATVNDLQFPDDLDLDCKCGKCATMRCPCRTKSIPCCIYCKCSFQGNCRNPHALLRLAVTL